MSLNQLFLHCKHSCKMKGINYIYVNRNVFTMLDTKHNTHAHL